MPGIRCPYKNFCIDYPDKCQSCENNRTRSYFKPRNVKWEIP